MTSGPSASESFTAYFRTRLGICMFAIGDVDSAEHLWHATLATNSRALWLTHYWLAQLELEKGNLVAADEWQETMDSVISRGSGNPEFEQGYELSPVVLSNLLKGDIALMRGDTLAAHRSFESAAKLRSRTLPLTIEEAARNRSSHVSPY